MKHLVMILLLAVLPAACIDSGGPTYGQSYGPAGCGQYTSCATCTPVLGCGWCSTGTKGACVDQPNACAGATSFSWTWELSGCPAAADGGTPPGDAGAVGDGSVD